MLAWAKGGVIFTPGSAGTIQEVFQDATQNHYNSMDIISPMIFYNTDYWKNEKPIYPLLKQLAKGNEYEKWLAILDEPADIINLLDSFSNDLGNSEF